MVLFPQFFMAFELVSILNVGEELDKGRVRVRVGCFFLFPILLGIFCPCCDNSLTRNVLNAHEKALLAAHNLTIGLLAGLISMD